MQNLNKFRRLTWADRFLLFEATIWLAVARLSLLLMPFRKIAGRLGNIGEENDAKLSTASEIKADKIGWAVRAMARRTPWESACLAQAIGGKAMLRRRKIPSTLYLGLAKNDSEQMQAHAWLRCGEEIITGKAGHEQYSVISTFAETDLTVSETAVPPDSNHNSLLVAVLNPTPHPATREKLLQLTEPEWQPLIQAAQKQFVASLFLARLKTLGVETAVPPQLLSQLNDAHQQITLQNMAMYRELYLLNQKLEAAEIPVILLKGAFLATAVYPHIGQRAMGDLDLLIHHEHLPQTIALLHELGWEESRPIQLQTMVEQHHHLPPFAKKGVNFVIEPHWNIIYPNQPHSIMADQLWQQVMPCTVAKIEALAFQPHLQLLHLALHASYNHQFAFDLRSLCDIVSVITHYNDALHWDQVIEIANAWHWQRGVYLTLALVNDFWETAVPDLVLSQLKPAQMPQNMVALAKANLFYGRTENKMVSTNFAKLKGDHSFSNKAMIALSFLLPKRNQLSWRYGVPENSSKIWFYYLVNLKDMLRRNTKRTWQLLRGTEEIIETAERRNALANWLGQTK